MTGYGVVEMAKKIKLLPLAIVLCPLVVIAVLCAGYSCRRNAVFDSRLEEISKCGQYRQCVDILGRATYDFKLDDASGLAAVNKLSAGQKEWRERRNANVALWGIGSAPAKFIYVVYDRTTGSVVETGWLQA